MLSFCEVACKSVDVAGKELFMIDHSLDDSDVKFLEEGWTAIYVSDVIFVRILISTFCTDLIEASNF